MADTESKNPLSFMTNEFQSGVEAFLRGGKFHEDKSKEWQEGWNFSMKMAFWRNSFNYVFGKPSA